MTAAEKLDRVARDIFWARMHPKRRAGKTKALLWASLTEDARQGYRDIARNFVFLIGALPVGTINLSHEIKGKV